ncbi:hypothetical protein CJF30_00009219 [Rutstroemia sp. NJR-2017a BBW]|nr:hypothetical protein CJF30_00009219 [Rutstroemia sp. NJR-2017a BBW]
MSGIEVAGLVLGAIPILSEAFKSYRESVITFFRARKYIDKLYRALLLQERILEETVKLVLLGSGCENIPDLSESPVGYLTDARVQENIKDYLGPGNMKIFDDTIYQSRTIIEKLAGSLTGLVPSISGSTSDLLQIIEANQKATKQPSIIPRVKFTYSSKTLMLLVEDLSEKTEGLRRLMNLLSSSHQIIQTNQSRKSTRIAKALRQVRSVANDLQLALSKAWKADCHNKHEVKLFLEDRVDNFTNVFGFKSQTPHVHNLSFKVVFAEYFNQGQLLWNETAIRVHQKEGDSDYQAPSTSKVKIILPQTPTPQEILVTTISDMCNTIETTKRHQQRVVFVLTENHKVGMKPAEKDAWTIHRQPNIISLKSLLTQTSKTPRQPPAITLKLRMLTALAVSSNLLQLSKTHWLKVPWSSEMVNFLMRNHGSTHNSNSLQLPTDLYGPFISLTFDATVASSTCSNAHIEPKKALLELGILLLEIWHQTTFESRFASDRAPTAYNERLVPALNWRDDTNDELLPLYATAISYCLLPHIDGSIVSTDWDDMKLWEGICGNVVEPLAKLCNDRR